MTFALYHKVWSLGIVQLFEKDVYKLQCSPRFFRINVVYGHYLPF